jgi:hypothetical protein
MAPGAARASPRSIPPAWGPSAWGLPERRTCGCASATVIPTQSRKHRLPISALHDGHPSTRAGQTSSVQPHSHSRRRWGASQPSHLARGAFRIPFPWGKSGPERAHLTRNGLPCRAKALAREISCESETATREDRRSHVCPSHRHLTVRERGVEPTSGRERNSNSLGVSYSSWAARPGPWGRCGAVFPTSCIQVPGVPSSRAFMATFFGCLNAALHT